MAKTLIELLAGEDMEGGENFCDDIYNNLKNHFYNAAAPPASPVNGMIWVKNDGTASVYFGGTWYEFYNEFTTVTHKWLKGADKPSAAALDISALDGNYFDVTGVAAITSITTSGRVGTIIRLHFDGILTLTHHATDLILPTGANITTAAGDEAAFIEYAAGDWRCVCYTKADGTSVAGGLSNIVEDLSPQLGGDLDLNGKNIDFPTTPNISDVKDEDNMASNSPTMLATQQSIKAYADTKGPAWAETVKWKKGVDKASANALDISALDGNYFDVTGVTAITSISTSGQVGTIICLHFDGILTFTHHATDLILPTGANITTAAGDEAMLIEYAAGDWRCVNYSKADGTPLAGGGGATDKIEEGNSSVEVVDLGVGYIETKADAQQIRKDAVLGNIQPLQPAFLAYNSVTDVDVTGDGTVVNPVEFDTEVFDQGGNFAASTFTAPMDGKYYFSFNIRLVGMTAAEGNCQIKLVTTADDYFLIYCDPNDGKVGTERYFGASIIVVMAATNTAKVQVAIYDGTKIVDIYGNADIALASWFSGYLVC